MKKLRLAIAVITLSCPLWLHAQEGEVTYISHDNIYVRFTSAMNIESGDTLWASSDQGWQPAMIVAQRSSISVVGQALPGAHLEVGQIMQHRSTAISSPKESIDDSTETVIELPNNPSGWAQSRGRFRWSGAAYVTGADNLRIVNRFNWHHEFENIPLTIDLQGSRQMQRISIGDSAYSVSKANPHRFALTYQVSPQHEIGFGRQRIRALSSLGVLDGLHYEHKNGNWQWGGVVGFRPDLMTYQVNLGQFQMGIYGQHQYQVGNVRITQSLGLMEQRVGTAVDRRFLYYQASGQWGDWRLFGSSNIDLYENFDSAAARTTLKPNSIYLSAQYRINDQWQVFTSWDSRQRIIFYETYDHELEQILADQRALQGLRIRVQYRKDEHWRFNMGGHLHSQLNSNTALLLQTGMDYRNLPKIGGHLSLQGQFGTANAMNTTMLSLRYRRSAFNNRLQGSVYARGMMTQIPGVWKPSYLLGYYGIQLSSQLANGWGATIFAEYSQQGQVTVPRVNFKLSKRLSY